MVVKKCIILVTGLEQEKMMQSFGEMVADNFGNRLKFELWGVSKKLKTSVQTAMSEQYTALHHLVGKKEFWVSKAMREHLAVLRWLSVNEINNETMEISASVHKLIKLKIKNYDKEKVFGCSLSFEE